MEKDGDSDMVKRIFESGGFWYISGSNLKFETRGELIETMAKLDTATATVAQVQALAVPMDNAPDIFQEYWDVVSAEGAYTDEELAPLGITAAQLTACIATIEAFNTLMTANHATVNVMRRIVTS